MNRSAYLPERAHRLDPAREQGVNCDANGPRIGPVPLLRRTLFGFAPRPAAELDLVLSKTFGVPARRAAQLMPALDAIADALDRGNLALAMITTLHLGLPVLDDAQTMRARRAETMLKAGFNPDEPRDTRRRWTSEGGEGGDGGIRSPAAGIQVAQNGPWTVTPRGFSVEHLPGQNPLDPMGLNKPVLSIEMQQIANALSMIKNGNTKALAPHPYQNLPHDITGEQLPASTNGYTSYTVPSFGPGKGTTRFVVENGADAIYYSSNHYQSFYPVTLSP